MYYSMYMRINEQTKTQAHEGDEAMRYNTWHENRLFEIRYTDGTTVRVESTNTAEIKEKALRYHRARKGEVDFHWVRVYPAAA